MSSRIHDPNLAASEGYEYRLGQQSKSVRASATFANKRVVAATTNGVAQVATNSAPATVVGIAETEATSIGRTIRLAFHGAVDDVPAEGTIGAGAILKRSTTSAGHVTATTTPAAGEAIGFAITASASGVVPVYLYGR